MYQTNNLFVVIKLYVSYNDVFKFLMRNKTNVKNCSYNILVYAFNLCEISNYVANLQKELLVVCCSNVKENKKFILHA